MSLMIYSYFSGLWVFPYFTMSCVVNVCAEKPFVAAVLHGGVWGHAGYQGCVWSFTALSAVFPQALSRHIQLH